MKKDLFINIKDVAQTAFLTLYCHAADAQSEEPILHDHSSIQTVKILNEALSGSDSKLHRKLVQGRISKYSVIHIAIRAKKYDQCINNYIARHPRATIVNIGCGLDNRFERVDNGQIKFYDLDLPDIIHIKRKFFPETSRYHFIAKDVFDFSWMESLDAENILFLAEGVFMYCDEADVKSLFIKLTDTFPGSEMICELFNSRWLKGWLKKIMTFKLEKQLGLGKGATFRSGIRNSQDIEKWKKGIRLLDEWCFFDSDEKKLGWLRIFRKIAVFRNTQWTTHYQLGEKSENESIPGKI